MYLCPKCQRKKRIITVLVNLKKRKYWVSKCIECKTPIKLDEKEDDNK